MKKLVLILAITVCFGTTSAFAFSATPTAGTSKDNGSNLSSSDSEAIKNNYNKTHSDGTSTTDTKGWSNDKQATASLKKMAEARKSQTLSAKAKAEVIIAAILFEYEDHPEWLTAYPKKALVEVINARNFSKPTLGADIGINPVIAPGQIDGTMAELYRHGGSYNVKTEDMPGDSINTALIKQKLQELVILGAICGQALLYTIDDISVIEPGTRASEKFKKNAKKGGEHGALQQLTESDIKSLGEKDIYNLFRAGLNKVLITGITNQTIKSSMISALKDVQTKDCRFMESAGAVACGKVKWTMNTIPNVSVGPISWLGNGFAGYEASYDVSASWSYSDMLDIGKSINSTSKVSHDFSKKVDDAVALGNGIDYVTESRTGVDTALKTTSGVNFGK